MIDAEVTQSMYSFTLPFPVYRHFAFFQISESTYSHFPNSSVRLEMNMMEFQEEIWVFSDCAKVTFSIFHCTFKVVGISETRLHDFSFHPD